MGFTDIDGGVLPSALIDEVEALAVAQQKSASEVVRAALEHYVRAHRPAGDPTPRPTPQEAGAQILARRPFHPLPEGETIRDLIIYGRA